MNNEKCLVAFLSEEEKGLDDKFFIPLSQVVSVEVCERKYQLGYFVAIEVSKDSLFYNRNDRANRYARIPVGHNKDLAYMIQGDILNAKITGGPVTYVPILFKALNLKDYVL